MFKRKIGNHLTHVLLVIKILYENEPENEGVFTMFSLHPFQPSTQHFLIPRHSASPLVLIEFLQQPLEALKKYLDFKHKGTEVKRHLECSLLMVELRSEITSDPKDQILNHCTA